MYTRNYIAGELINVNLAVRQEVSQDVGMYVLLAWGGPGLGVGLACTAFRRNTLCICVWSLCHIQQVVCSGARHRKDSHLLIHLSCIQADC